MKINSTHLGELDVADEKIIDFPKGIIGFPEAKQFCLFRLPDIEPYQWLQSVDQQELAFVVAPILLLKPDYKLHMTKADHRALGFKGEELPLLLGIVVIPEDAKQASINYLAPVAINEQKRIGGQIVNECRDYKTRHIIKDDLETAREGDHHASTKQKEESILKVG